MVNYSLESLGQSFRSGNHPTEMELELEMASIRDGMSELGAESDMLDRAFNSAELAMNIIKNFKDEDQCLELLKCQATMESLINVNGGTINDLTVSAAQEGVKEFFKTIWEKIKAFFAKLWDYIKRFFTWLGEKMGLIKEKSKKTVEVIKKTDKKTAEKKLRSYRPNKTSGKEAISAGTEEFQLLADALRKVDGSTFYKKSIVDKVLANIEKAVQWRMDSNLYDFRNAFLNENFVEECLKNIYSHKPIDEHVERINQASSDLDELYISTDAKTIPDRANDMMRSCGMQLSKASTGRLQLTWSSELKPADITGSLYDLGYKSAQDCMDVMLKADHLLEALIRQKDMHSKLDDYCEFVSEMAYKYTGAVSGLTGDKDPSYQFGVVSRYLNAVLRVKEAETKVDVAIRGEIVSFVKTIADKMNHCFTHNPNARDRATV